MQAIAQSYRGSSLLLQLGADRIFVPLAIAISLMEAAGLSYQLLDIPQHISPGFY